MTKPALGPSAGRHCFLHVSQRAVYCERFDGIDLLAGHHREKYQAAVYGAIRAAHRRCGSRQVAGSVALDQRDGTGAALPFGATFLRAGEPAIANEIEEGHLGRRGVDADGFSVQQKLDAAHGLSIRASVGQADA
jgi:hypothetical protein